MEHLRIGDIVVELRTSYGASVGSEVKIETLSIHGEPDAPSVTMVLRLTRAEEKAEVENTTDVDDKEAPASFDYLAELEPAADDPLDDGRGGS